MEHFGYRSYFCHSLSLLPSPSPSPVSASVPLFLTYFLSLLLNLSLSISVSQLLLNMNENLREKKLFSDTGFSSFFPSHSTIFIYIRDHTCLWWKTYINAATFFVVMIHLTEVRNTFNEKIYRKVIYSFLPNQHLSKSAFLTVLLRRR